MVSLKVRFTREYNRIYKAFMRWQWRKEGMAAPIVLMVHGFVPSKDQCSSAFHLTADSFEKLLTMMQIEGWHAMNYEELKKRMASNRLEKKMFYLTFDDVYDTVYTEAYPILEKLQIPFTIFITQNLVGKCDSKDKRPFITKVHLQKLVQSELCTIGCHGINHRQFRYLHKEEMTQYCIEEQNWLRNEYGVEAKCLAFPFGRWQDVARWNLLLLRELGFEMGFSAIEGTLASYRTSGRYFLPRVNVSETFVEKFINHQPLKWKDCEGR